MPTFLLTIERFERDAIGVRLFPGFHMLEAEQRPGIRKMIQGCLLELRPPNALARQTHLVTYGVPVEKSEDGSIIYRGDIKNFEIRLTVSPDVPDSSLIPGTQVWLCESA
jgi:hypothetical protein